MMALNIKKLGKASFKSCAEEKTTNKTKPKQHKENQHEKPNQTKPHKTRQKKTRTSQICRHVCFVVEGLSNASILDVYFNNDPAKKGPHHQLDGQTQSKLSWIFCIV